MLENVMANYSKYAAVILFAIGFFMLLLHRNLMKKIIGMNIMDTAVYVFLTSCGYIKGGVPPIDAGNPDAVYVNPLPTGLVLTGIVVAVSVTSIMLALTIRLYKRYRSLNLDDIYMKVLEERELQ